MKFAHYFIDRPILAAVLSLVVTLVGSISLLNLPVEQYPDVVPPTVRVNAAYPGANPQVIAETVSTPIEQAINGVENLLFMASNATSDGVSTTLCTFKLGTNLDKAQTDVQNRVNSALAKLPEEVRRLGVNTTKQSTNLTMVVHLLSKGNKQDPLYVGNYAFLHIKDQLQRLPGVGSVEVFGARDYAMRIWLDPDKIAARNLTATEVVRALREQNVQVAAGVIGAPPSASGTDYTLTVTTQGRLVEEDQFREIIVKSDEQGRLTRVKDIGRVELAARDYSLDSFLSGEPASALVIFQQPGTNSLDTREAIGKEMERLKESFPPGLDYSIVYDTTIFARQSIAAVEHTLFEAILLVVLVVIVFLQTWRASIIPLLAVPVSLIGTFAVMHAIGFSLNNLSLFGLVLAIGIVVDDAIVVVENVERNIDLGLDPKEATRKAMDEVSGPIFAVAIVLCAVFIPTAFMGGIAGQFYKQFALTIAVSTLISAFNSLTLSPALSAILLRKHGAKPDWFQRIINILFGWFFWIFNWVFTRATALYGKIVGWSIRLAVVVLLLYGGLLFLTATVFKAVPPGFIPQQDKGYLILFAQLPDGSSLERSRNVILECGKLAREIPGVTYTVEFPGFNLIANGNTSNAGTIFIGLDEFSKRRGPGMSDKEILGQLYGKLADVEEALVFAFLAPPVDGVGNADGFEMQIKDMSSQGTPALAGAAFNLMFKAQGVPEVANVFTSIRPNAPQLEVVVDKTKAKAMGVPLSEIYDTLQIYLGSAYVNDFNRFGRIYQVTAQADQKFRMKREDITRLQTRNLKGDMVPLGSVLQVREVSGLDVASHYNMVPTAKINGSTKPGFSSGDALAAMEKLAKDELPPGYEFEWTGLTLQEKLAGNTALIIFPICVFLVFLSLAAQYESWTLPLAILLIVPMCILSAMLGIYYKDLDNNVFTQIGLVVLVGLSAKNAILIVEFAKHLEDNGMSRREAAIEASRLRLRPILMTSFAFILGVLPLVTATGAGAEMRQALGTTVFYGMLGVTIFGLLLTPVFYVTMRWLVSRKEKKQPLDSLFVNVEALAGAKQP